MARLSTFVVLLRTTMASLIAISAATGTRVEAQSAASDAYQRALADGSVQALERFIEQYPMSPEANAAFRDLVLRTRGSTAVNRGPAGLMSSAGGGAAATASDTPFQQRY